MATSSWTDFCRPTVGQPLAWPMPSAHQPTPRPAAIYQQQHCRSLQQREYTMNSPPFSRIYYEFTVYIVNLVRILVGIRWFSMNSVGVSRTFFEFTICFANSLWIFYLFHEYIKNWRHISRIYYLFSEYTKKSLSISRISPAKKIRNHNVIVWMIHMSHKIEFKKMSDLRWLIRVFSHIT